MDGAVDSLDRTLRWLEMGGLAHLLLSRIAHDVERWEELLTYLSGHCVGLVVHQTWMMFGVMEHLLMAMKSERSVT